MRLDANSHAELAAAFEGLDASFVPELLELTEDENPKLQAIASWLLRRGIEGGLEFGRRDWQTWMSHLPALTQWAARLHFCQAYHSAAIPLSDSARAALEVWCGGENAFVRAWAMSALVRDASLRGGEESRIESIVAQALADPAASVRARARQVVKSLKRR